MRWLLGTLLVAAVFISGALYGIEKNNEKLADEPKVVTPKADADEKEESTPRKTVEKKEPAAGNCAPSDKEEHVPWISKMAGGVGEGIAVTFNGVIVVLAEVIQSGAS